MFAAVDLAKILGRNQLFIGNFYVNFRNTKNSVPLSKIIQLSSLLIPVYNWDLQQEKNIVFCSCSLQTLQQQYSVKDLEVGCCFMFPLPGHKREEHIRAMRFHPIFYELISSFLQKYPSYQVVHYRMENDFPSYFFKKWHFTSLEECRAKLFQQYQNKLTTHFDPNIPTLVVSHYYKDPQQIKDHDLKWKNLIHFNLTPSQRTRLYQHLQLSPSTPMREVDAIIDFILSTTPNVCSFIGCGGSTFSGSVCLYHNNKNCTLVSPVKN